MSVTLSLRLPEELAAELDRIASETERSKSFHVQKAIESYLKEQADLQIALDRSHDSSDAVISMDEMRNNLGL
ncbi:MAG TPA: ribbon-helix-helix domain-containing protein [bacterium]|nr:ribbon-helix-helix domain-containing protein [bacterium]HPM99503.1 ribbon-helix-helix domain-containing protein [bacterium]